MLRAFCMGIISELTTEREMGSLRGYEVFNFARYQFNQIQI
jgi:hypothetical protein